MANAANPPVARGPMKPRMTVDAGKAGRAVARPVLTVTGCASGPSRARCSSPRNRSPLLILSHLEPLQYPGQALAVALYREGGIRGCEIGSVMFGRHPDGSETPANMELVRLAIPRRVYTQSHVDYVIEVVRWVAERAAQLPGYRIVSQPPQLRHFTARFETIA